MPTAAQQEHSTSDLDTFREFLAGGAPGPHAYVVLLGLRTFFLPDLLRRIEHGFSYAALERLHRNVGVGIDEITELVQISPRTVARRRQEGRFLPEESDRLLRAARLFAKALELFEGDAEAARAWLTAPQTAFGGTTPLHLAKTEIGSREVETLIDRLEQGVYS